MIAVLGFLAATVSIVVIWPQVWVSCRHGRTRGLSPTSCWLAVGLNLCWLTFGLLIGDVAQVVTNAVVGVGNTAVLSALLIAQPHLRSPEMLVRTAAGAAALAALAAGSVAAVVLHGAAPATVGTMLGAVISLVGAAAALPQPLRLLRDRTQDVSGISAARWRLGAGSCAAWAGYGWLVDQPVIWLSACFGLGCALLICGILQSRQAEPRSSAALRPLFPAAARYAAVAHVRAAGRPALAVAA